MRPHAHDRHTFAGDVAVRDHVVCNWHFADQKLDGLPGGNALNRGVFLRLSRFRPDPAPSFLRDGQEAVRISRDLGFVRAGSVYCGLAA